LFHIGISFSLAMKFIEEALYCIKSYLAWLNLMITIQKQNW